MAAEEALSRDTPWSGNGREALSDAVRKLTSATVSSMAPPELLLDVATRVHTLVDELNRHAPGPDQSPVGASRPASDQGGPALAARMPFDMIIGSWNPIAPPISLTFEPPRAIGSVTFGPAYEGAPGCVHGAALAGAFDIMLTAANVIAGAAGPTVELSVRYLKPTLISEAVHFEAWVTRREGRRIHSWGRCMQSGVITVEANGEYIEMDRSRIESLHRRDLGRP
jgi:acyl-coenzyme A thioesterase PaaI-like protein